MLNNIISRYLLHQSQTIIVETKELIVLHLNQHVRLSGENADTIIVWRWTFFFGHSKKGCQRYNLIQRQPCIVIQHRIVIALISNEFNSFNRSNHLQIYHFIMITDVVDID